ncbi:wax ester/triacylglycerol synthase family O-acyltransferase [Actinomycetospora lutea]|uniref:wax ester/triacylglycerol synthase domain-containing protein n=1 Tax=Actinomycetospora lutea TaxID=663604 RepID=UPI0023659C05|nr:wax ester/triacylglycerol synthase domain-containing protein [Actinomycetospora lutea]MDD7937136.1 wax ester/triacylglycerol synthase family O-acyltransferase [Actinomycetospora lutea]
MDRWASGIDTAWLQLEQPTNRMVVHGILFCAGPVDVEVLRERVRERWVAVYPGLRQRPVWPAGGLGPVRWTDHDPDLTAHVDTVALEAPGDDAALARHVGALMSRPLPEDRPWWAMHVLTGRAGDGSAVVVSIHHGLADGVALNHLFHALADEAPGTEEGTPVAYAAPPKRRHGVRDVRLVRREIPARLRRLTRTVAGSSRPGGARELAATGRAIGRSTALIARPPADARTALQGELGEAKAARWTRGVDLEAVKWAGKEHGASVNDVLCAAIAGALRAYLGEDTPRLRAVMPTNLRRLDRPVSHWLGNEFGLVLPTIPTDEPDLARRVERMHRTMAQIKRTNQALATFIGIAGAGHGRAAWTRALVGRYAEAATLIITNVPGPARELTLAGTPVRDLLFWVPCSGRLALGVSILSYAGRVRLGVAADTGVLGGEEGVDRFVAALDDQVAALSADT